MRSRRIPISPCCASWRGLGAGADVVSEGEFRRALAAGIPPERIVFSGIGKTASRDGVALAAGIHQINVESVPELRLLSAVASARGRDGAGRDPRQSRRRRAHPRQDRDRQKGKQVRHRSRPRRRRLSPRRGSCPASRRSGLAVHIGSQLTELAPFARAVRADRRAGRRLRARGLALERSISAAASASATATRRRRTPRTMPRWSRGSRRARSRAGLRAGPGLVGNRPVLLSPGALRQGGRDPAVRHPRRGDERPDPAGALRGLARDRAGRGCPPPGALLGAGRRRRAGLRDRRQLRRRPRSCRRSAQAIWSPSTAAGAYGAVMSSRYNTRLLVPEVLVAGDRLCGHPGAAEL